MGNFNNELKNYQSIPRALIFDNDMSDRARFLFCYMASKPDNWDFYIANMTKELGYSDETLRKYINELISCGWLIKGEQSNLGKFGAVEYTLKAKKSDTEKSDTEKNGHGKSPAHKEKENNKDNNKDNKEDTIVSKKDEIDYAYIKEQWEIICPMLASIRDLNPKRKKAIANTLKNNNANVDDMIKCFKIIASSEFCKGDNKQAWKATFDWIINDTKSCFNRLLEGEFSKNMYEHKLYESIMKGSDNSNDNVNKKILINGVEYK